MTDRSAPTGPASISLPSQPVQNSNAVNPLSVQIGSTIPSTPTVDPIKLADIPTIPAKPINSPPTTNSMPHAIQADQPANNTSHGDGGGQPNNPTTPIKVELHEEDLQENNSEPSTQTTFCRFVHFFITFLLVFEAFFGIYSSLRFIILEYPKLEQSFIENKIGEEVIMNVVIKIGLLLLATAISLFFALHTNIFHRKKATYRLVVASIAAILVVSGILFVALRL